ncbi:MAG: hypothetical protein FWF44_00805, partial [Defluviitaleaceae bacterium]|nr:hypothetical protein [Defluviitaleaceae bacterium]
FYYTFQKTKPIMISRFAVSRYSSADRAYRDEAASAEITRVYSAIVDRYPRIKLINYMDFNGILLSGDNTGDNFSISDSDKVMAAYSSAIGDSRFLSAVDTKTQGDIAAQWMKSPFPAYKSGNGVYISADSYRLDLNISGLRNPVEIGGVSCYSLDALKTDQSKSVSVDDKNMQIWVSGK